MRVNRGKRRVIKENGIKEWVMTTAAPQWPEEGIEHARGALEVPSGTRQRPNRARPAPEPSCPEPDGRTALRVVPHGPPPRPVTGTAAARLWTGAEREPSDGDLAAARRRARAHLPPPAVVTRGVAMALLEVEAGCRSAVQLERICSPQLWARLEQRIGRRGGPLPSGRSLVSVQCQEDTPGLADTVAVVQRGDRVLPVAMRLDASSGRWAVTELRWWRTEAGADPSPCRDHRGGW
jgi:hypothetical protein